MHFQHRFGAFAMLSVLTGVDLVVDSLAGTEITELRFETDDGIDDLVIESAKRSCLVQAKRYYSLSSTTAPSTRR